MHPEILFSASGKLAMAGWALLVMLHAGDGRNALRR